MKVEFVTSDRNIGHVTFTRQPGDRKYYGGGYAKGEHNLFHFFAKWLNGKGFSVIKKRAQSDGHMLGDEFQPYIRTRKGGGFPHVAVYSGFYALRGANEDWNQGEVTLCLFLDYWMKGQDTAGILLGLAERHPEITVTDCRSRSTNLFDRAKTMLTRAPVRA